MCKLYPNILEVAKEWWFGEGVLQAVRVWTGLKLAGWGFSDTHLRPVWRWGVGGGGGGWGVGGAAPRPPAGGGGGGGGGGGSNGVFPSYCHDILAQNSHSNLAVEVDMKAILP